MARKSLKKKNQRKASLVHIASYHRKPNCLLVTGKDFPLCLARHLVFESHGRFDLPLAFKVLGSYSLNFTEKWLVVNAELSLLQVEALLKVFDEEEDAFVRLTSEHPVEVMKLTAMNIFIAFILCRYLGLRLRPELESALCRRMVQRALRRGARKMLLKVSDEDWRDYGKIFCWFWKHGMPAEHLAWNIERASIAEVPEAI
jgi:hypothetical protein